MSSGDVPAPVLLRVLCLGDIVGRPGRRAVAKFIAAVKSRSTIDLVIANGENASGGLGIDPECAKELRESGVDLMTLGDHTWQRSGIGDYLSRNSDWIIRPANYPAGALGSGWLVRPLAQGGSLGLFNLMGRVYINSPLDCPFKIADEILNGPLAQCRVRICDLHAGATSEKVAMGRYLDGRASMVFGTHTHVQTADECVLSGGTGFISDLGMCGPVDGVIGMASEVALARFLTGLPHSYKVAPGRAQINGVIVAIDPASGKASSVERVREVFSTEES